MLTFYPQETRISCVPACLRMVMAQWGLEIDEETLRACCKTDLLGTLAKDVVACAHRFGFEAAERVNATTHDLYEWLDHGLYPILYLNLFPLDGLWVSHAVVLEQLADDEVFYLDPARGRRSASLTAFAQAWQMSKQRAIVVMPLNKQPL